jgi:hypothetical protein
VIGPVRVVLRLLGVELRVHLGLRQSRHCRLDGSVDVGGLRGLLRGLRCQVVRRRVLRVRVRMDSSRVPLLLAGWRWLVSAGVHARPVP